MTETWMNGRGAQQDHDIYGNGDASHSDPHRHMRSSLGQLIERSISAPPSSDTYENSYSMQQVGTLTASFAGLDLAPFDFAFSDLRT